jgi:copper oxidase (laccase) domain-containing protein
MEKKGIRPRDMVVALGPSIGPCCFEVGPEVTEAFEAKWGWMWSSSPHLRPYQGRHMDLKAIAKMQLLHTGVLELNIDPINLCTYCGVLRLHGEEFRAETNDWASHRRATHSGLKAARQWSAIRLMSAETERAKKAAATGNLII